MKMRMAYAMAFIEALNALVRNVNFMENFLYPRAFVHTIGMDIVKNWVHSIAMVKKRIANSTELI
ncbi:MAG: hypothetical protein ACP5SF_04225 [Thermoplasmata archaeon]